MDRNDFSITDAEFLYMIRQMDMCAMERVRALYIRLLWKRSHDLYNQQMPGGTTVDDIHQEAYIGFKEALYGFCETRQVGLAYYLNLCVMSSIQTNLRKCRSGNFTILNTRYSLDAPVGDSDTIRKIDLWASEDFTNCPAKMASYYEIKETCDQYLDSLKHHERNVHALREEGYSYSSIAQRLDISPKDVDNIVQKIRRNMKGLFHT